MNDKIIPLNTITTLDIPVDRIIDAAKDELDSVIVIGWDKHEEFYFASSLADGGDCLWLLEMAKKKLMEQE